LSEAHLPHDWFPRPLPGNVVIGDGSWFYSSYALRNFQSRRPCGLEVGRNTGVYINTFFDLGPDGEVRIGAFCTISGPVFSTNARVEVGDRVLISEEVVIADHFATTPRTPGPRSGHEPDGSTATIVIGDNAWIGSRAVILAGARLGTGVIVGAGAVVDFEVAPYAIVVGNPARIIGWARPGGGRQDSPSREAR
jgi:acetyltransferase-like isoleucine patch superfamily enzyme